VDTTGSAALSVGLWEGTIVGFSVTAGVVGLGEGAGVGLGVGDTVGSCVGLGVGDTVGSCVGLGVGDTVGPWVGLGVGDTVGLDVGECVGDKVGRLLVTSVYVISSKQGTPAGGSASTLIMFSKDDSMHTSKMSFHC